MNDLINTNDHNMAPARDAALKDAKAALRAIGKNDNGSFEGWIAYGKALNEARSLFPADREFGKWLVSQKLDALPGVGEAPGIKVNRNERAAAMWAAANPGQVSAMQAKDSKVRTVRGLHTMWGKYVLNTAAAKALNEIEDDAEAQAVIETIAAESSIPEAALSEARETLIAKDVKAAKRKEAQAEAAAEESDAVRVNLHDPKGFSVVLDALRTDPAYAAALDEIDALRERLDAMLSEAAAPAPKPSRRKAAKAEPEAQPEQQPVDDILA